MKFNLTLENGKVVEAEVLEVVELDGKEYLVYCTENADGTINIDATYVQKDSQGYDEIVFIHNSKDYEKIQAWIQEQLDACEAEENTMQLWEYKKVPNRISEERANEWILGPMLHGQTSVVKQMEYSMRYKEKGFFGFQKDGEFSSPGTEVRYWMNLPEKIKIYSDFGMEIPVKVSCTHKLLSQEEVYNKYRNQTELIKKYQLNCEVSWSKEVCKILQEKVQEFANHVYSKRRNILEKIYEEVIIGAPIGAYVEFRKDGVFQGSRRWETDAQDLEELNAIQMYGLALALQKYIQEEEPRKYFTDLQIDSYGIFVSVARTKGKEAW